MCDSLTPCESKQNSDNTNEVLAMMRQVLNKVDILEQRFEYLDRDVLNAVKSPSKPVPAHYLPKDDDAGDAPTPLAIRCDGVVLLSVDHAREADIVGRERWEGIVLSEAEACDAIDMMESASHEAAARIVGRMKRVGRKETGEAQGPTE